MTGRLTLITVQNSLRGANLVRADLTRANPHGCQS
ncbi:hypothetical protein HCU40_24165 [Pseudanabaena biceps]|nr:hypothetical protein [Pseudanabaena biceps]